MFVLPPYAELLQLKIETDGEGAPRVVMPFHEGVIGRPGFLHGGAIAGLLEVAAFAALRQALGGHAVEVKPITVTVDYMRGGQLRETFASAVVERLGARIANVEAQAWQRDRSTPIAAAQMNFLLARQPAQ